MVMRHVISRNALFLNWFTAFLWQLPLSHRLMA